ncbi:MAG: alpha/beta hydrolase [Planctomycetota bacterium]
MSIASVSFPPRGFPDLSLEGELLDGGGRSCVVSHPHPLAGGNMDHPVSAALWRAAGEAGLRALRYNFRGVGQSSGRLTSEPSLALADLCGAIDFLGGGPLLAIGYSYGARTTLHAIHAGEAIDRAVLAALPSRSPATWTAMSHLLLGRPIRSEDYESYVDPDLVATSPRPVLLLAGDRDPLVQIEEYRARGVAPVVFEGVNHFFSRRRGNQPPEPQDLAALADRALAFLRAGE